MIDWIEDLSKELGLSFQPKKMIKPTTYLEFLRLELDSIAMEVCLPQEKLTYLCNYLVEWQAHKCCILREIQELLVFLQFCMQVIPHGSIFIHGLIDFSMMLNVCGSAWECRKVFHIGIVEVFTSVEASSEASVWV